MGWWISRGIAATGYLIFQYYDSGPGDTCYFDSNPDVQAVYCD